MEIKTSINAGSFGGGLTHFAELATYYDKFSEKLLESNKRALLFAQAHIEGDITKRGGPGKYVKVDVKKNGPYGLSVRIYDVPDGADGYKARMFMQAESGITGRKAYTLNNRIFYVISHSSGRWNKGTHLGSPIRIPAVPAFAFSTKNGGSRITIKKMAYDSIVQNLNRQHGMLLKRGH
jgi:hypothetical protein